MTSAAGEVISNGSTAALRGSLSQLRSAVYTSVIDWPLVSIVIFAIIVRTIAAFIFPGAIDGEGAEYARIAQNLLLGNGYIGIAEEAGKQLFFPPLFPFLIASASLGTGDAEVAGRIISVTMGAIIVLPTYYIAAKMYDRVIAIIASLFIAFNPYLIFMSTTVFCEMTFMAILLTALCFAFAASETFTTKNLLTSGALYGLAYLVRPEGAVYLLVGAVIVFIHSLIGRPNKVFRAGACAGIMIFSFAVVAAPYVVWLSLEIGKFRIEGKSPLNIATATRLQAGEDPYRVQFGVDRFAKETGVWNQSNIVTIKSRPIAVRDLISYIRVKTIPVIRNVLRAIILVPSSPILFAMAIIGFFTRPWNNISLLYRLHISCVLFVSIIATYFIYYNDPRFYVLFIPFMGIWGVAGARKVVSWIEPRLCGYTNRSDSRRSFIRKLVMWALLLVFMIGPSGYVAWVRLMGSRADGQKKAAGAWIYKKSKAGARILSSSTIVAFHAKGSHYWLPGCDEETALLYARKNKIQYVVLYDDDASLSPYLKKWVSDTSSIDGGKLVYSAEMVVRGLRGNRFNKISIIELKSSDGE